MTITVPHNLTQDEALARIKGKINEMLGQYGDKVTDLQQSWDGPTGTFSGKGMGMQVSGTITVQPHDVVVNLQLPIFAAAFKPQIEERVREGAKQLLG